MRVGQLHRGGSRQTEDPTSHILMLASIDALSACHDDLHFPAEKRSNVKNLQLGFSLDLTIEWLGRGIMPSVRLGIATNGYAQTKLTERFTMGTTNNNDHSAVGAALGFYYQSFYALHLLLAQKSDDASVGIELLDDVQLTTGGMTLLAQLKHSVLDKPAKLSIKSVSLWKTLKVWLDVLPSIKLSEVNFHMVTVAGLVEDSGLEALMHDKSDRSDVLQDLIAEAKHVISERESAMLKGIPLPYGDRASGCESFLAVPDSTKELLLLRVTLKPDTPPIRNMELYIADSLPLVPTVYKGLVIEKLIQWWDQQIVYSLCNKRSRVISFVEVQLAVTELISEVSSEKLVAEFEGVDIPDSYQPNGTIARQINLVNGSRTDHKIARRDEWRAREERSKWVRNRADMATTIGKYDDLLTETWEDRHDQVCDECKTSDEVARADAGRTLLKWVHENATGCVTKISGDYQSSYYVRGSYHVLASEKKVGWHPDYLKLLKESE